MLLGIILQCGPPSCTLQKRPFFPLQFGQEENISRHSIESRVYWFVLKIARVFPVHTGRVGIGWWTLLQQVTLTPYVRDSSEDKSMLLHFKKSFSLTSLGHSFERIACWFFYFFLKATRDLADKPMLFTLFYLYQEKKRNLACISSKQVTYC